MNHRSAGITLIELLLVISLIILIGTPSAVFFSRFLTQMAVLNTQDQLIGQLRKAQLYAMSGKQNSNWGVNFSGQAITLFAGNSYATRTTAFDETFRQNTNIMITGLSEVVFSRMSGSPSATGTFTITGSNNSAQVTVNAQGVMSR